MHFPNPLCMELQVLSQTPSTLEEFLLANGPLDDWAVNSSDEDKPKPKIDIKRHGPYRRSVTPTFAYMNDRPDPLLMCSEMEIYADSSDSKQMPLDDYVVQQLRRLPRNRGSARSITKAQTKTMLSGSVSSGSTEASSSSSTSPNASPMIVGWLGESNYQI